MEQLTGLDTSYLNIETATTYGHVGALVVFEAGDPGASATPDDVKRLILERIHLVPPYRRRLVEVPFGLDHPYWIEDPNFDIDFHVRHIGLPPPGDSRQLADQVARLVSRPLDRSRPLWELYIIEGLEGGRVAQLTKIHHCAIDGMSGAHILASLLDLEPEPRKVDPPASAWRPEPEPTQLEMLARGLWGVAGTPRKGLRLARQVLRNLPAFAESVGVPELPGTSALSSLVGRRPDPLLSEPQRPAPRTFINGEITPHRRFAFGSLSLAEVKEVKDAHGVTVNDVILAICAGGLRRYLQDHSALPADPLVAMVPVSVRTEEESESFGNKISAMAACLHTDLADPLDRLARIHETMDVAKKRHKALPASLMQDFAQFAPPAVAARAARVVARATVANLVDSPFNVVISNVPGPQFPLYGCGARLVANYPVSAINDGVGLNITVQSYNGNLDFGLVACREVMPDLWDLMENLREGLDELKEATKLTGSDAPRADSRVQRLPA